MTGRSDFVALVLWAAGDMLDFGCMQRIRKHPLLVCEDQEMI